VYLNQNNAYELLWRSAYREHHFTDQMILDVQRNQAHCGAATITAALDSLRVKHSSTELSVEGVVPYGLNLQQVASLFQCHLPTNRWNIHTFHATPAKAQLPSATLSETIFNTNEEDTLSQ